jgi:hypothetical protein
MSTGDRRSIPWLLLSALGLSLFANGWLLFTRAKLSLQTAFADDQIATFQEMRDKALRSSPGEGVSCLSYVVNYYPSGTKQQTGSHLDRLVERERQRVVAEILADLRARTGRNLGDDSATWIRAYDSAP